MNYGTNPSPGSRGFNPAFRRNIRSLLRNLYSLLIDDRAYQFIRVSRERSGAGYCLEATLLREGRLFRDS